MKKNLTTAAFLGLGAAALAFGLACFSIYRGIRDISNEAASIYGGDRVAALRSYVDDESRPLANRNRAVWALGQLGDKEALPILEKYNTGGPCDHDRFLCQKELRKAIKKCRGTVNITSWINGFALKTQ